MAFHQSFCGIAKKKKRKRRKKTFPLSQLVSELLQFQILKQIAMLYLLGGGGGGGGKKKKDLEALSIKA